MRPHYLAIKLTALTIILGSLIYPNPSKAWGAQGHRVVAEIAEDGLTASALKQIKALLAIEHHRKLAEIASWADDYRTDEPESGRFHFVNIEIGADGYNAAANCGSGCVVSKLADEITVLRTQGPGVSDVRRLEALKWITHLVGDLAQPLHCSDNGDGGGNGVTVTLYADGSALPPAPYNSLHSIWDTGLLQHLEGTNGHVIAAHLEAAMTQDTVAKALAGDYATWAQESWKIGRQVAYRYPGFPARTVRALSPAYEQATIAAIDQQLTYAGIRLGAILNSAFRA